MIYFPLWQIYHNEAENPRAYLSGKDNVTPTEQRYPMLEGKSLFEEFKGVLTEQFVLKQLILMKDITGLLKVQLLKLIFWYSILDRSSP